MITQLSMCRLKGFSFPHEIVSYVIWEYHRFALSVAGVEKLLAKCGAILSHEAIRFSVNNFGARFYTCISLNRLRQNDKWYLGEIVITTGRVKHWLWRAVDASRDALGTLVKLRSNAKTTKCFFKMHLDQIRRA